MDAGEGFEILLPPGSATLAGSAIDTDGPQALIYLWTQVSGPGTATFDDATLADSGATFPIAGTYVLKLEANDSLAIGEDEITITVKADIDGNGIADDIDAAWAAIPTVDITAVVNDANKAYYDPDGLIASESDLRPIDDYDGDGIDNLTEMQNGNYVADFFNGETPVLSIWWGNGQTAAPQTFTEQSLYVKIENAEGIGYLNAPVRFEIASGDNGEISRQRSTSSLVSALTLRTFAAGATAYFYAPELASGTETSDVIVSLPDGQSVTFTITTDADFQDGSGGPAAPGSPVIIDGEDLTTATISWADNSDDEISFRIERSENGAPYEAVNSVPANTITWTDTGLDPSKVYFYRIVSL